ncbi:Uncharacterized conserved protein YkwD, contains CAP (CSP/antigen 5/PR1) domain [Loktanella fryxellensis]|uniref:Uncharacterized conserved protein YkwD, contains CAP (CSP/antigen 5/PR1) domain n=1 Tax=Loktanella fryxellensis TaxID=245187 RepID=A0A1H8AFN2_9RHOB|nr:CAP domain-containing protein [Loktanella fryxellensis]SEM68609.1 Uncharacterized conserved protein YkwD, contains CAP (CSP/antigen 5/PR1) domain [Loktanella fryxellensis]
MLRQTLSIALATLLSACVAVPIPVVVPLGGAAATGAPAQALAGTPPRSAAVDQALNSARAAEGRRALVSNAALDRVADQYAAELAQGDKLMMGLPTGADAGARLRAAGVSNCTAGEVIAQGYPSAGAALGAFLSEPRQRRVLLGGQYANYGLGTAADRAGRGADVWVVVLLMPC